MSNTVRPDSTIDGQFGDGAADPTAGIEARTEPAPTHDEIAARAYQRYLERGRRDGFDLDDWLDAERELTHLVNPVADDQS